MKESDSSQVKLDKGKRKLSPKPWTAHEHRKKVRQSTGGGLQDLAASVETAMEKLAGSLDDSGRTSPKTYRQQEAIAMLEEDEELSPDKFNDAVVLMTNHSNVAASYLAIKNTAARRKFLTSQIETHIRGE